MPKDTICKTVHQYNKTRISPEDMAKLGEIAEDCRKVKDHVYRHYGGIKGLGKLYPGYTIQNEMSASGLRQELGLPSVYFYLAVFDALGDIKSQWTRTKAAVLKRVNHNEHLTQEEKHFLRYLLRVHNAFEAVLNHRSVALPQDLQRQYQFLAGEVDGKKMENYIRRQVRSLHGKLSAEKAQGFSLTERAYRYEDHGIYVATKEKRKRIFIPLTDNNRYTRQIYMKLFLEEGNIEIKVPIDVAVKKYREYKGDVGLAMGMMTMFVTDEGHRYGDKLGEYQSELTQWVRDQTAKHRADRLANPGRKKYDAKKRRLNERIHSYINMELNRFLKTEEPAVIYIPKLPGSAKHGGNKAINHSATMWQRGYIRKRLEQKCTQRSVRIVEVFGKGISSQCSQCGAVGKRAQEMFSCSACGFETEEKINTARNVKKRGMEAEAGRAKQRVV
jgi:transposase